MPDIDLDFPRDIREKLIVAVTERYGREHAALVASFSTYRSRGAIRDVGKALGLPFAELERLARLTEGNPHRVEEEIARLPDAETKLRRRAGARSARSAARSRGLPRHISQHPGGMVISTRPLVELVPVQPAAMAGRQICQWDKDSCADAGFLKIDLLGLGMLSAVEDCVEQIAATHGETIDLSRIPLDDPDVYDEIQRADTVGDFQIESRAQMQSLLRTRPENLDDLTSRSRSSAPGRSRASAVHPYIEHRQRLREDPSFVPPVDHPLLAEPLRETLGVVVFQDQVLEVAIALAGFSVGGGRGAAARDEPQAERGGDRGVPRAVRRGRGRPRASTEDVADEVYDKLVGFSGFGFPKSHAAAFGLLAYQSAWLRHHYPAEFLCALLNAQPMGFYPPASLVRDAQRRGVEVRPPDVNRERRRSAPSSQVTVLQGAVRIGLEYVTSLGADDAQTLVASGRRRAVRERRRARAADRVGRERARGLVASGACDGFGASAPRAALGARARAALAERSRARGGDGAAARAAARSDRRDPDAAPSRRSGSGCSPTTGTTSLSVGVHPIELLRPHLPAGTLSSQELAGHPSGSEVAVAGMAVARQRPSTANGVVFMLLEDEFGQVNLIVPPPVYERYRAIVRGEPLLLARGMFERVERNQNVVVRELETLAPLARTLSGRRRRRLGSLPDAHHFGHR